MLKRLIRKILYSLGLIPPLVEDSWNLYKDYVSVHPTAIIDPTASIKIFNPPDPAEICLEIGEGSHVFSRFSLLRPQAKIKVGKNCQLGHSHFICADSIEVGDDVLMAWGVTVIDTDSHALAWDDRKMDVKQCRNDYLEDKSNFIKNKDWSQVKSGPIRIGSKSWIGFNSTILKKISLGKETVVGACSVVTSDTPSKTIVAGNPARVVKTLN